MRPPAFLGVFRVTLVRVVNAILHRAYLLRLALSDAVLHRAPPILVVAGCQRLLQTPFEGVNLKSSAFLLPLRFARQLVALCTLLESDFLPGSAEAVHGHEIALNVRIGYFSAKLLVLLQQLRKLLEHSWEFLLVVDL